MADRNQPILFEELPMHIIIEILCSGRLMASDLACLESSCRMFRTSQGIYPHKLRSMAEFASFQLCTNSQVFSDLSPNARGDLLERCDGNWKKVLRFLQSVEQSSGMVETSAGKVQVSAGRYHTLLILGSSVYSCGSSICGVLGHGQDTTQCGSFKTIEFPSSSPVVHVSAFHNHAAFVTQSGEVTSELVIETCDQPLLVYPILSDYPINLHLSQAFTCGDNSSFCCGIGGGGHAIFRPTRIKQLNGVPCKQVATGLSFTMFLTRQGNVYTCGANSHGQLGHGDTQDRPVPEIVEYFERIGLVVQIAAGSSYALAVVGDGTVYSCGSCNNFCLGYGDQHNEQLPRPIEAFKRKNIHILRVSAGDEHAVALDSSGYVYTWGRGYCGALGHGDENDKITPELVTSLKGHIAVQVCARKRKTFVLMDDGSVFACGWMGFGSLGFPDMGSSDKVLRPRVLTSLKPHCIAQISTGLYHTLAISKRGLMYGFGDNERAQLGLDLRRSCPAPAEISKPHDSDENEGEASI